MRVSTAFNRLLQIPGASVTDVSIGHRDVEVTIRPRTRRLQCPCGILSRAVYDRRRRRWRHLDLGRHRLWLGYEIRRLDCPQCGVRTEELPRARPGARHTRDYEDMVLWLAQRTDRHLGGHSDALRVGNRHRDHPPRRGRAARCPPTRHPLPDRGR